MKKEYTQPTISVDEIIISDIMEDSGEKGIFGNTDTDENINWPLI